MSSSTATTLVLKPQAVVPAGLVEAIVKTGVIEWSYGAANGDFMETQIIGTDKNADIVKTMTNMRTADTYLDDLLVFQFIHGTTEVNAGDHQPFEIVKDADGVQIIAFAEGDFPSYEDPDKLHSNEYYLVQEFLDGEIKKVYQENDEDLAKTMQALADETYRKTMLEKVAPRGVITIQSSDGSDPVTYAVNEQGLQADWGYVSRTHGWSATETLHVAATATPGLTPRQQKLAAMNAAKPNGEPAPTPVEPKPATTNTPKVPLRTEGTATKIPDRAAATMVQIPTNLRGKHVKKYHEKHFGKNNVPVEAAWYKPRPVTDLLPTSHLARLNNLGDLGKATAAQTAAEPANPGKGIAEVPPMMPPQLKKTLMENIKKGNIGMYTPEQILEVEKEFPSFSDQIGEPLEKLVLWSNKTLRALTQQELFCYANQMRHEVVKAVPSLIAKKEEKPLTRAERLAKASAA